MPHCFNTLHGLYVLNYFEANIKIYLDDYLETQSNYNVFMMTASNGNNFRVTGPLCREFTGHLWIPLTKASDVELWCFFDVRLNKTWINNHEAGDLRCHRAHYDVIIMLHIFPPQVRETWLYPMPWAATCLIFCYVWVFPGSCELPS